MAIFSISKTTWQNKLKFFVLIDMYYGRLLTKFRDPSLTVNRDIDHQSWKMTDLKVNRTLLSMVLEQNYDMFWKAQTKCALLTKGIFDVTNDRRMVSDWKLDVYFSVKKWPIRSFPICGHVLWLRKMKLTDHIGLG